ncbi:MAG: cytochrome c biogenesis protein CcdA [Candidatus Paceibacterota bacterium]
MRGLVMFLAPCTLPLVPGFVSFISYGEKERVVKNAFLFCLGFILTFALFGLLAGLLGGLLYLTK